MNGELLRRVRKQRGLTIAEAAESVGISRQSLSNYERGVREPSLKVLIPPIVCASPPVGSPTG